MLRPDPQARTRLIARAAILIVALALGTAVRNCVATSPYDGPGGLCRQHTDTLQLNGPDRMTPAFLAEVCGKVREYCPPAERDPTCR